MSTTMAAVQSIASEHNTNQNSLVSSLKRMEYCSLMPLARAMAYFSNTTSLKFFMVSMSRVKTHGNGSARLGSSKHWGTSPSEVGGVSSESS